MDENEQSARDAEQRGAADESNSAIRPLLQAPGNLQLPHRITNFFIDNILRPDFGRKKEANSTRDEGSLGARENHNPTGPSTGQVGSTVPAEGTSTTHTSSGGKKAEIESEEPLKTRGENVDQCLGSESDSSQSNSSGQLSQPMLWPAWVYCTRYSDRPSSGSTSSFNSLPFHVPGNLLNLCKVLTVLICTIFDSNQAISQIQRDIIVLKQIQYAKLKYKSPNA